jgi:hypothetical protein
MARNKSSGGRAPRRGARKAPEPAPAASASGGGRKLIAFDPDMLQALTLLARDRMQSFQELADEAFADVLKKHGRPVSLQQALRESVSGEQPPGRRRRGRT